MDLQQLRKQASVERFVALATEGRRARAEATLAARPELERDRWVRLVLGRGWDGSVDEVGGPRGWAPLHYVCHSVFAPVALARDLLERGADPNAFFANDHGPMSTLYGAAGVLHSPELTALLLEHGADPNGEPHFGDALYHATEAEDPACLRLLLAAGAEALGSNALGHALDEERPAHVRLLLEHGAGAEDAPLLVHAVRRGRDAATVRALVEHGVPIDRPGGEWSTPRAEYRTAYQNAVLRSRDDLVALLAELGADTTVSDADRAVAAIGRGERPAPALPARLDADAQEVVGLAALRGHLELVVELLGPEYFCHIGGGPPGTLLHHAAWVGNAAIARRLLELGADPLARSGAEFDTPLEWAALASGVLGGADRVAVAELLVAAGAPVTARLADVAEGPLAPWLADRLP